MITRKRPSLLFAAAALLCAPLAQAFELNRAETSAEWFVPTEPIRPYLELSFSAELGAVESTDGDLSVGWGEVGGIDPTPFRLVVPAECMVRDSGSMLVRAFRACGVSAQLTTPEGRILDLPIYAFSAVMTERRGFARLSLSAAVGVDSEAGDVTSDLLGTIGGATQSVSIGDASGSLLPNDIGIRGFNPQPEPPALVF